MPVGLLPCRCPRTTRGKSPPPVPTITPCVSKRAHRRRSDASCGTRLPAEKYPLSVSFGDAQTKSPARTILRACLVRVRVINLRLAFWRRWRTHLYSSLPFLLTLRHSSSSSGRGRSLSTDAPPGRLVSVPTVVGDWDPTSLPRRR